MKKILIMAITAIVSLNSIAAWAENPYVGMPPDMAAAEKAQRTPGTSLFISQVDRRAPASINGDSSEYHDGSAHRFGDASPSSYR